MIDFSIVPVDYISFTHGIGLFACFCTARSLANVDLKAWSTFGFFCLAQWLYLLLVTTEAVFSPGWGTASVATLVGAVAILLLQVFAYQLRPSDNIRWLLRLLPFPFLPALVASIALPEVSDFTMPVLHAWQTASAFALLLTIANISPNLSSASRSLWYALGAYVALAMGTSLAPHCSDTAQAAMITGTLHVPGLVSLLLKAVAAMVLMWKIGSYNKHRVVEGRFDSSVFSIFRSFLGLCITLLAGWLLTEYLGQLARDSAYRDIRHQAAVIAAGLPRGDVAAFADSPGSLSIAFARLHHSLTRVHKVSPELRYIYIVGLKENTPVILLDTEPMSSDSYAAPGTPFTGAPDALHTALQTHGSTISEPYRDRWGYWVSGFAPISESPEHRILLGVDFPAEELIHKWMSGRCAGMIAALLFCNLTIVLAISNARNRFFAEAIREQGETEVKYRDLIERASDGIAILQDLRFVYMNSAAAEIAGMPREHIIGRSLGVFLPTEFFLRLQENYQRRLNGEDVPIHYEYEYTRPSGERLHLEFTTGLIPYKGGKASQIIIRDVTKRKLEAEELRQAKENAERSIQIRDMFLRNMSHELRTPLNVILGMADLLRKVDLGTTARSYVDSIRSSGEVLLSSINAILDLTRMDTDDPGIEKKEFHLVETLDNLCTMVAAEAHQKGLELVCHLEKNTPRTIVSDPVQVRQVLANLVGNAIKFTARGEIVIRVAPHDDGQLVFSVSDTGIGVPREHLDLIFDDFAQADHSITRNYGGSGLGLAISRRLVSRLGGKLWLESDPGKGSTFLFTITAEAMENGNNMAAKYVNTTILIAAPNPTARGALADTLRQMGATCAETSGRMETLRLLDKADRNVLAGSRYDLVLIDAGIDPDGFRLVQEIRSMFKDRTPPIGMLLDRVELEQQLKRLEDSGACGHVVKPVTENSIPDLVDRCLTIARKDAEKAVGMVEARILLVEDSPTNCDLIQLYFSKTDYVLGIARNGQEGLDMLFDEDGKSQWDLVIMDMQMPVLDGYEATRKIREHEQQHGLPAIPVIALTAHALADDREKCIAAGCSDYLTKPIKRDTLIDRVNDFLQRNVDDGPEKG